VVTRGGLEHHPDIDSELLAKPGPARREKPCHLVSLTMNRFFLDFALLFLVYSLWNPVPSSRSIRSCLLRLRIVPL
jgi:hypothetical protein